MTFLQCKENPQIQYNITIKYIRYHEKISCQVWERGNLRVMKTRLSIR